MIDPNKFKDKLKNIPCQPSSCEVVRCIGTELELQVKWHPKQSYAGQFKYQGWLLLDRRESKWVESSGESDVVKFRGVSANTRYRVVLVAVVNDIEGEPLVQDVEATPNDAVLVSKKSDSSSRSLMQQTKGSSAPDPFRYLIVVCLILTCMS